MNHSTITANKTNQRLSLDEASVYLASNMNDKQSASYWKNYLKESLQGHSTKYGGYRVKCEVVDGNPHYSETTLKVFIKLMGSGADRTTTMQKLRQVDKKSIKNERKRYQIKGASKLSKNDRSNIST